MVLCARCALLMLCASSLLVCKAELQFAQRYELQGFGLSMCYLCMCVWRVAVALRPLNYGADDDGVHCAAAVIVLSLCLQPFGSVM